VDETETIREHVESSLPLWKCHKVVRAAPIRAVYPAEGDGSKSAPEGWMVYLDGGPAPDGFPSVFVKSEVFVRGLPMPGDYFVIYDDGYQSWSPKKTFEEGYSQAQVQEA
jgi:hypothetical protein